ncbi:Crp/Fnr family transcriptional regulator [Sphingorhabdus sp. Alg239-R122]|uniref:Crp/Fnr family transcriptional regulator n=1 Tax=Sphingorhabdus sp. Alg239-R122 TaxID=2305989 RepID=UPI0013DBF803|nr:Crp/Fnr family transcriptional regulator [Sphingorhabdus sp. Alg239-R122]
MQNSRQILTRPLQLASFYTTLPEELRHAISAQGHIVAYEKGQMIHQSGDSGQEFTIIDRGGVRFSNTDMNGYTNVLTVLTAGEAYGELPLFAGINRAFDAYAAENCRLRIISKIQLDRLMDSHPELRDYIIGHVTRQFYRALQLLEDERRLPLRVRLAKNLLEKAGHAQGRVEMPVRQNDLAEEMAVSRVALSKALKTLAVQGLMQTGYGSLEICDVDTLIEWIDANS